MMPTGWYRFVLAVALCAVAASARAQTVTPTLVYTFGSHKGDGVGPSGGLVTNSNEVTRLYGTTSRGGASHNGTVYVLYLDAINRTQTESVLYSFNGQASLKAPDGAAPFGGLISAHGILYGTTSGGGSNGAGTIFAFDPKTKQEAVLYSFLGGAGDGSTPVAGLTYVSIPPSHGLPAKEYVYGTTTAGGTGACFDGSGCGTVFRFDLYDLTETVIYNFQDTYAPASANFSSGAAPTAGLVVAQSSPGDTMLYGTTSVGPVGKGCTDNLGCGTLFVIDTAQCLAQQPECYQSLHFFGQDAGNGALPSGNLTYDTVTNTLFGTTRQGGLAGCGTVGCGTVYSYGLDPSSPFPGYAVLPGFGHTGLHGPNGLFSFHKGIDTPSTRKSSAAADVRLFGVANSGGANHTGGIFEYIPTEQPPIKLLSDFPKDKERNPGGPLTCIGTTLYGTTSGESIVDKNGKMVVAHQGTIFSYPAPQTCPAL